MSRLSTSLSPTASTSSSTPARSSSFFAFRSKSSTVGSPPPNKLHRASMNNHHSPPKQRPSPQRSTPQTQPENTPQSPPPPPQQQLPPPQPQQSRDQQPSTTQDAPLHPEIRSIVSLTMAHTQKIYFSGPLVHKLDRNPDGQKPHKDEGWHDVWAQLYGTTLSIWDMGEVKMANQQGKEVPPSYVNITEAFVHVLGALTQPATAASPSRKYTNVITLNTAGTNLLLFSCPSAQDLISWATAFRLSCWEKSRLEEMYSAHLVRITLNDGRNAPSTLTHGRLEGWVRVRIAGKTGWRKLWMSVSAGTFTNATRSSIDVASINSKSPQIPGQTTRHSYVTPKKNRISSLFSRERSIDLPERATVSLYAAPRGKDKKKPLLTFDSVTQAFAVYPERPKLISSSTLIKLEGTYGDEDMCANMKHREGWMLLMPDLEGARSVSGEMLKWLIAIHDAFELYGRPKMYSWDPRDPVSMMFAYPIGPDKQLLFLDREVAETLDPREERTPVVRSKLLSIMIERMRSGPDPKTNQNGALQLPSTGGGVSGQNQNQQPGLGSNPSVPRLGVLTFEQSRQEQQQQQQQRDGSWTQPLSHPSDRRALTPITERSTRDSNSWDTGGNPPTLQRPGFPNVSAPLPHSDQIQEQQSETSQDLPKLQVDAESSTFLGEPLVTSPSSHIALHEFAIGRTDSARSFGSKRDSRRSQEEASSPSRPDSKLDTHVSTDAVRPAGDPIHSPINSPGKESVFSALPSPYSNQPIHPVQSTFSDISKTTLRSPEKPVTPPSRKGPGLEPRSGSPTPSSSSRFQGATRRREASSPTNSHTAAAMEKMPESTPFPCTDPHPNTPMFSPTPTTTNSPPTLTHTATTTSTTSKSEYSGYSGMRTSPMAGTFSSPRHSKQGSYSQSHSHSTSQSQRTAQDEPFQKESLSTFFSGRLEGVKPVTQAGGEKEGSGDDHDLIKEAGALYYIQATQDTSAVSPPKIVGRGQNIPVDSRGQSDSNDEDEDEGEPSTEDEPRSLPQRTQTQSQLRQRLPLEPSPPQARRLSAQAKTSFLSQPPSSPQQPTQSSHYPSKNQYQDGVHAQVRDQRPILAPQPQQPATSSFNSIKTMEGDVRSPNSSYPSSDTNPTSSVVESRRTSVIGHGSGGGQGGGSRSGLVSRPSGARDLVLKQRGGTGDSIPSYPRHNGQPRHPLPSHPESFSEQPSQFSYSTHPPHHQGQTLTQTLGGTTQQIPQAIGAADKYPTNMASVDQRQHYDDNSDALAALTFLERDEANGVSKLPPRDRRGPTSETEADAYDTPQVHVTPSDNDDVVARDSSSYEGKYRSSFAPSKQATQRLAKSQAQQAAHQAAVHRPGKNGGVNGKGKRRVPQDSWAESSDEEEEEDEDDEDVDSDGDPVVPWRSQGPGPGPGQNPGKLSTQDSPHGSTTDLHQPGQARPQRHLPRPPSPSRGYGDQDDYYHQQGPGGPGPSALRQPSAHYPDPTRSQHFDDRKPSPQPHGHNHLRPQSDFPTPGAARQTIWSQALENKDAPKDNGPQRETFVQIEPSHTMTKAFAVHGLLSAGLQDRQERSAKRQEEVAKETGASLVNVPIKPPPPQTGLLGAVSAHERERKREGGIGAALTERERERRMAEERQRKLDDFTKQQLEMVQSGSMYGPQFGPGFNPMMANPMMGMNPMMSGWGFNPMMGNPQMFAAQQAAAQAYQQTMMMTFAQNMGQSQAGGEGLGGGMGGMGSPGMLSPMATGQQPLSPMMTGQFDPRMSMMGMPMMGMMGMGMGMGPMSPMMTGQSGVGPGMGGMGGGMGIGTGTGGGLGMQATGGSAFDPRLSPFQLDLGGSANPSPSQGSPSGPRPVDALPPPSRSPANASPAPK